MMREIGQEIRKTFWDFYLIFIADDEMTERQRDDSNQRYEAWQKGNFCDELSSQDDNDDNVDYTQEMMRE